jgi:hypothetical protein
MLYVKVISKKKKGREWLILHLFLM